jgi:hypothetical protein
MDQDTFLLFPLHDSFPLFEQSLFFCTNNHGPFSPRDLIPNGCSPRPFFATSMTHPGNTQMNTTSMMTAGAPSNIPDTVDWESNGSVGSRRASDEFSEASTKQGLEWRKSCEESESRSLCKESLGLPIPLIPLPAQVPAKLFLCREPGCKKVYTTTEGLRLHNRNIHMKDKRHKCSVDGCSRAFVRASDLKLHILRIHEKERPFPCTEPNCAKSFACNSELTRHLNCHYRSRGQRKKLKKSEEDA